jgi:hypothetical protein
MPISLNWNFHTTSAYFGFYTQTALTSSIPFVLTMHFNALSKHVNIVNLTVLNHVPDLH